jgi:hypothetical protein
VELYLQSRHVLMAWCLIKHRNNSTFITGKLYNYLGSVVSIAINFIKTACPQDMDKKTSVSSRVLLEKLTVTQLFKKFPTFYGTRRFITMFTTAHYWSLS